MTAQIEAVAGDFTIHATKIGMLANAAIAEAVAAAIAELDLPLVVVDPVMVSTSGTLLLAPEAVGVLLEALFPLAVIVTPNLAEAGALAGGEVRDVAGMRAAARALHARGPQWVLVTGGHLAGPAVDVLFDGDTFTELEAEHWQKEYHITPHVSSLVNYCTYTDAMAELVGCKPRMPSLLFDE